MGQYTVSVGNTAHFHFTTVKDTLAKIFLCYEHVCSGYRVSLI